MVSSRASSSAAFSLVKVSMALNNSFKLTSESYMFYIVVGTLLARSSRDSSCSIEATNESLMVSIFSMIVWILVGSREVVRATNEMIGLSTLLESSTRASVNASSSMKL